MPGTDFNKGRNKLFFFFSQDILPRTDPGNLNQRRMPTALERSGDFSQTFDGQGRLINIRDPLLARHAAATTGGPAASRATSSRPTGSTRSAQTMLNLFPLPNATDPTGARQYNYAFQTVQDWPRNDQVLRMDWNVGREDDVLRARAVGLREARRRRDVAPRIRRRLAAAAEQVLDPTPPAT